MLYRSCMAIFVSKLRMHFTVHFWFIPSTTRQEKNSNMVSKLLYAARFIEGRVADLQSGG